VAGYSLGGNITMKLPASLGASVFPEVKAFAAVSPVIELEELHAGRSSGARTGSMSGTSAATCQGRMRRKERHFPGLFNLDGLWKVWSIRTFDDRYTAPPHGYQGAGDYYRRASAMRVIDRVARPALILSAADDPFVPPHIFDVPEVVNNPNITTVITPSGGHCAFVEPMMRRRRTTAISPRRTSVDFLVARL
jgi:predicted alpha/beta-fold hydrolase